jgi:hypothetical protein
MELACTRPPCSCRGAPSRAPSAMAASLARTWLGLRPSVAASSQVRCPAVLASLSLRASALPSSPRPAEAPLARPAMAIEHPSSFSQFSSACFPARIQGRAHESLLASVLWIQPWSVPCVSSPDLLPARAGLLLISHGGWSLLRSFLVPRPPPWISSTAPNCAAPLTPADCSILCAASRGHTQQCLLPAPRPSP